LSKRNYDIIENWKPYLYFLLMGLQKLPDYCGEVFRALDRPISELSKQYKLGNNVVWVGFTSTSKDRSAMESFSSNDSATLMLLDISEGKDISEISLFPESEVLLLPNAHFVVKDVLSDQIKKLLKLPQHVDALYLVQSPTPLHLKMNECIPNNILKMEPPCLSDSSDVETKPIAKLEPPCITDSSDDETKPMAKLEPPYLSDSSNVETKPIAKLVGSVLLRKKITLIYYWNRVELTLEHKRLTINDLDEKKTKIIQLTDDWKIRPVYFVFTLTGKANGFEVWNSSTTKGFVFSAETKEERQRWLIYFSYFKQ